MQPVLQWRQLAVSGGLIGVKCSKFQCTRISVLVGKCSSTLGDKPGGDRAPVFQSVGGRQAVPQRKSSSHAGHGYHLV